MGWWEDWENHEVFAVGQVRHPQLAFCISLPFVWPVGQVGAMTQINDCRKVCHLRRKLGLLFAAFGKVRPGVALSQCSCIREPPSGPGSGEASARWDSQNILRMKDRDCDQCLSQDPALLQPLALHIRGCGQNILDSSLFTTWDSMLIFHARGVVCQYSLNSFHFTCIVSVSNAPIL